MGKKLFYLILSLFSTEIYNRVDKINLNNTKIVSPEKTGKKPFTHIDPLKQIKTREVDDLAIETQIRHIGTVYVEKKGTNVDSAPGVK